MNGLPTYLKDYGPAWQVNPREANLAWFRSLADYPTELLHGLAHARANNCNLLANVGPLPDGSIHPDDIETLRAVGKRIRSEGWPIRDESVPST